MNIIKRQIFIITLCLSTLFCTLRYLTYHEVSNNTLPLINQHEMGYPRGCEGISLYMAMRSKGYLDNLSVDDFMASMPLGETPLDGFMGDPKLRNEGINIGKRTTIYPEPTAKWGDTYAPGKVVNMEGATISELKAELDAHHPIIVWVTSKWRKPKWKDFSFGPSVTNNHALCLVGYNSDDNYYICDCGGAKARYYWVSGEIFEPIYNARHFAVVVR